MNQGSVDKKRDGQLSNLLGLKLLSESLADIICSVRDVRPNLGKVHCTHLQLASNSLARLAQCDNIRFLFDSSRNMMQEMWNGSNKLIMPILRHLVELP